MLHGLFAQKKAEATSRSRLNKSDEDKHKNASPFISRPPDKINIDDNYEPSRQLRREQSEEDLKPAITQPSEQALHKALHKIGPRVYRLNLDKQKRARVILLGCEGKGIGTADQPSSQELVADLIEQVIGDGDDAIVLGLGDHIYDEGASHSGDPGFETCFHQIYGDKKRKRLRKTPFFMLLGNHDANRSNKTRAVDYVASTRVINKFANRPKIGDEVAINEIAHSYRLKKNQTLKEKKAQYRQNELHAAELNQWNMPYYYYSLILGETQIFCLDSNTLLKDYLDYKQGIQNPNKPNQYEWFLKEHKNAFDAKRKIVIAMHHTLFTSGKRADPLNYDTGHYLEDEELNLIQKTLGTNEASYNKLYLRLFKKEKISADMFIGAHDHFNSLYNDKAASGSLCQVTAGGGGGHLQSQKSCAGHPYMGYHLPQFGITELSFDLKNPDELLLDVHTIDGLHLKFNEKSHLPIQPEDNDICRQNLRVNVLTICHQQLAMLKKEEEKKLLQQKNMVSQLYNFLFEYCFGTNEIKEIKYIQEILTYFNQYTLPDTKHMVDFLSNIVNQLPEHENSFQEKVLKELLDEKELEKMGIFIYEKVECTN